MRKARKWSSMMLLRAVFVILVGAAGMPAMAWAGGCFGVNIEKFVAPAEGDVWKVGHQYTVTLQVTPQSQISPHVFCSLDVHLYGICGNKVVVPVELTSQFKWKNCGENLLCSDWRIGSYGIQDFCYYWLKVGVPGHSVKSDHFAITYPNGSGGTGTSPGIHLEPETIDKLPHADLPSSKGVVEKAINALKFDVLSPRENQIYYGPVTFRVIMPVKTRRLFLRIGKKDPDTGSWDTEWMMRRIEREDFIDKGAYYLWEESLVLPPTDYYFVARPGNPAIPKGPAAADKDGIQFRVASPSEKPHISVSTARAIMKPRIVVRPLSQKPPWHPGDNHSVRWTSHKVPGKVRIFLVRGKTLVALLNANRYEWSPPGGVDNTGYWRRNLPRNIRPDEHYRILIESVDDPKIRGLSEFFPIRMKVDSKVLDKFGKGNKHLSGHLPAGVTLPKKPSLKPGRKPPAQMRLLKLKNPRGMETFYLGQTCDIKWQSSGIEGNIRIILEDEHGKRRTLNGMMGTKVGKKHFPWKIGYNIKPGSMYKIYLKTPDGKVKSKKSGGFNIFRIDADKARKLLKKKNRKLHKPPKKLIPLN